MALQTEHTTVSVVLTRESPKFRLIFDLFDDNLALFFHGWMRAIWKNYRAGRFLFQVIANLISILPSQLLFKNFFKSGPVLFLLTLKDSI